MAATMVDVGYLSGYLKLPQQTLDSVVDAPTSELVRAVLAAVSAKAREHDEVEADKIRVDIELESAVRSSETRIEGLKSTIEKSHKTLEDVRIKLKEEENAKASLESELQSVKSSTTTSSSEIETLRARIKTLESGNRDTIVVLESKAAANDSLSEELQKQHQKGLELSQQNATLQQEIQAVKSNESSAKFREQSLKQEFELAKRNNEWFEAELKTKIAEASKFRKEKGAKIAELQRLNEECNSNLEASKRTEQALRTRLADLQNKAEEALSRVQQLEEAAAQTQESFRQELDSAKRLAQLQGQQSENNRKRVTEVEVALQKAKDDAAEEIRRYEQELEAEREGREQDENRIQELEAEVDRLEGLIASQARGSSVPGTPRRGLNGSVYGGPGSPGQFDTPGSARGKPAITITQALDELYKVKAQLATEKRKSSRLEEEIDSLVQSVEAKQPEMEEMQDEYKRLQLEVVEMSEFVDQANKERDRAKKDARKAESELSTSTVEISILRKQLRDLGAQIKMLLSELHAKENGLANLNAPARMTLESYATGEPIPDDFEGVTETDKLISQRLVVFRNIIELQENNVNLLKITRQLGEQMESEEAKAAKTQAADDHEEVQTLLAKIEGYRDELQATLTRSESYVKERDMFRRMAQSHGQLVPTSDQASMFGQSVDGAQNGILSTTEQNASTSQVTMLRELQAHFDQYRQEQDVDRRTLKEQAEKLALDKGSLQAEIARTSSQLTLASERYEMLHSNYTMLQNENAELQKRSSILSEAAAKQDIRTQQVAEDLVEAKSMVESMRNENSNLKAEKKLWKDREDRLSQENETLINDRSRLNTLITNQQAVQNERELSDSENRRRLQSQVEGLENELSTTKRKLDDEVEENKKAQLRKEYDAQQSQKRIDDLAASLSQAREELIAAKTSRDHLQARVDELTIELKSSEERVELLQPRPTPRSGANGDITDAGNASQGDTLSREQELAIEVSTLKRDLELTKSELENAKDQMEQYKSISQASEEQLHSMNETQDLFLAENDRTLEEKDTTIRELQQRILDITSELTTTNNELTKLRNDQSEVARQSEEKRAILESEVSRLKDEDERHAAAAQFHQQDLRAQAAIAAKAQQDYENELVKHAEVTKLLQSLRVEHNQLKTEVATFRAEAESARATLSQNELSWEERQENYEQELSETRKRQEEVKAANKLLQQQLEHVGNQVSELQQSRASFIDTDVGSPGAEPAQNRANDGLREINSFLRREKEIVEVQYDIKIQEAKRLQQQLDYVQLQLDESKLKLEQERRLHADGGRNATTQKDIMEKLNELNVFRESSTTLRNEARQLQAQLTEKSKQVEELTEKIQPLENRIRELENTKEMIEGEKRLVEEDRDRWQKRTQDIISKYDRIDPVEMEQLKETIESLRAEKDLLVEEKQPLHDQLQALETEKANWLVQKGKIVDQAKERSRVQSKTIADRTAERDAALQEKTALQEQLEPLKQELEAAKENKTSQQEQLEPLQQELEAVKQEKASVEEQVVTLKQEIETLTFERDQAVEKASHVPANTTAPAQEESQSNVDLEQKLSDMRQELDVVTKEKQSLKAQLDDLRIQLDKSNNERDAALTTASSQQSAPGLVAEPDTSRDEGQVDEHPTDAISEDMRKDLENRIANAEAKAKEAEDKLAQIEDQMETTLRTRSDKMKNALNKKLIESKEAQKEELRIAFEEDYKLKLEQEKRIILAEQQSLEKPSIQPSIQPPTSQLGANDKAMESPLTASDAKGASSVDWPNLSDAQCRDFISTNPTAKSILTSNIKKKVEAEALKLKEAHEKTLSEKLAEAQQKAEAAQAGAITMTEKKFALKTNMAENRAKAAIAKIQVVETAASETPQKPVVEVWEIAKVAKPIPPATSTAPTTVATAQPSTSITTTIQPTDTVKTEIVTDVPPAPSKSSVPTPTNGTSSSSTSGIPLASSASNNNLRAPGSGSMIPQMRGGGGPTRGNRALYQPGGNRGGPQGGQNQMAPSNIGRGGGRGGGPQHRGGLNPGAQQFSPQGQKRGRDEGSIGGPGGGHGAKRPRGGGP